MWQKQMVSKLEESKKAGFIVQGQIERPQYLMEVNWFFSFFFLRS
jgi:hypothetical protein